MLHPSRLFEFGQHRSGQAGICSPVMSCERSSQMGTVDLIRKVDEAGPLAAPPAHICTQVNMQRCAFSSM